jgi:ABC-2 type transport system ATP-binding protein
MGGFLCQEKLILSFSFAAVSSPLTPFLRHLKFWVSGALDSKGISVNYAVEVKGLRKTFASGWLRKRKKEALRGVDLSVPEGAFWGLLGPNGAGKTTLLSIISNLLIPEQGEVRVLGKDLRKHATEICRTINVSSGHANFLWSLNVRENLEYYAMLYGISGKRRRQRVEELLNLFDLTDFARVRFDELSTGTKQKLSLAKSLVNDPALLLLDEPTVGLDPDVAHRIREAIQSLHREKGTTILMTTHNMKEAETLCEQVAFIKDGRIKALGKPKDLKNELRLGDTVIIVFSGPLHAESLQGLKGIYALQTSDSSCRILVDDHHERLPQILDFFIGEKVFIHDLRIEESDLEDVFMAFAR